MGSRGYAKVAVTKPDAFREHFTVTLRSTDTGRSYEARSWSDLEFRLRPGDYEVNVQGIAGVLLPFASQLETDEQDGPSTDQFAPVVTVREGQTTECELDLNGQFAPHRTMQVRLLLNGVCYEEALFKVGKNDAWQIGHRLANGNIQYQFFEGRGYTHLQYDGGTYPIELPSEGDSWIIDVPTGSLEVQLPTELEVPGRTSISTRLTRVAADGSEGEVSGFTYWVQLPEETHSKERAATSKDQTDRRPQFEWDAPSNSLIVHGVQPGSYQLRAEVVHQTQALGGRFRTRNDSASPDKAVVDMSDLQKELWTGKGEVSVSAGQKTSWAAD